MSGLDTGRTRGSESWLLEGPEGPGQLLGGDTMRSSEAIGLDQLQERPFCRRVCLCEGQVGEERSPESATGETKCPRPAL